MTLWVMKRTHGTVGRPCGNAASQGSTMVTLESVAQHACFHLWRAGSIGLRGGNTGYWVCVCVCMCEVVKCVRARAHMWTFIGKHYYLWLFEWHRLNFSSNKVRHNNILLWLNLFRFSSLLFFHYLKFHFPCRLGRFDLWTYSLGIRDMLHKPHQEMPCAIIL